MPEAKKLDLQLSIDQHQLLYSIILELGLPSNKDAWARVISRLPPRPDGKVTIAQAASQRYTALKRKWDQEKVFGENHDKMVEEALKPRKAVKQSDKKMVSKEEEPHGSEQTAAGGRGRKNLDLKGKEKEEFEADVSSVGSEDEQASGSEHSEHEEEEAFAAGPSNKRNKRFLEGEDLEEPLPKRREAKKTVRFQVPEDDLPCWSEIEVETEV